MVSTRIILSRFVFVSSNVTTTLCSSGSAPTLVTPSISRTIRPIVSAESGQSQVAIFSSTVCTAAESPWGKRNSARAATKTARAQRSLIIFSPG